MYFFIGSKMQVFQRDEKTFVVAGEKTKQFREQLRTYGGKFNRDLRAFVYADKEFKGGPGWIFFSMKHFDTLSKFSENEDSALSLPPADSRKYQLVKYKVFAPKQGMNVVVKSEDEELLGEVFMVDNNRNGNFVETVHMKHSQGVYKIVVINGRWQVLNYSKEHTVRFS